MCVIRGRIEGISVGEWRVCGCEVVGAAACAVGVAVIVWCGVMW